MRRGLLQNPEKLKPQGQKQPMQQPTKKLVTGLNGSFKIYGINIPELKKRVEKF